MTKKPRTAKQLANDERLRQMAAARKAQDNNGTPANGSSAAPEPRPGSQPEPTLNPGIAEEPAQTISDSSELDQLKRQIEEMKANMEFMARMQQPQQPQGAVLGQSGGVLGTRDRYIVDPANYPSPIERLAREPKLERFGIKGGPLSDYSYELSYRVDSVRYQTIDGIWQREPKFELELNRVVYDEDTQERTNGRYTVCRLIMHEDPEAAVVIARENGIPVDETNEKQFLDEMRYLRMRDWLTEAFIPPKPVQQKQNKKEMAIGGKLVEYFEVNSETSESIPFSQLNNKA